jgi:rubrerythrin
MSYDFNADNTLEMAEQIERNGAKFYRTSADSVEDPPSKELLKGLAAMEDQHEKTFASMRAALTEKDKEPTTFDPDNESIRYLKALADSRVFVERQIPELSALKGKPDKEIMEEILKFAIGAEKESIIFYLGMKDIVPASLGKDKLDGVIKEEMSHIRLLSNRLVSIKRG